ncbi:MAG: ROK family protein [Phycisphaerales bacterium]|nr:MAG: ROK family protein [Phycisphaerales bacterium]
MAQSVAIGIDLGGTNLKVAAVDGNGRIVAQHARPVNAERGPDVVVTDIAQVVGDTLSGLTLTRSNVVGVGVGTPGPLNISAGRVIKAANLPGWKDVPLRDLLADSLSLPVSLDNDGNAAAYGEYWAGAGRGTENLVMLTLGTGVGAGVILDGQFLHGYFDNAGELGHMIVETNGVQCSCGQRGCLEQYASAAGVARRVVAAIKNGEDCALTGQVESGLSIDASDVARCAGKSDAVCLRIWDEACLYLAIACINIQHAYNPARIVLGGGMSNAGSFLLERVKKFIQQHKWSLHDDIPDVALATLGYDAGVIGAAGLAWAAASRAATVREWKS